MEGGEEGRRRRKSSISDGARGFSSPQRASLRPSTPQPRAALRIGRSRLSHRPTALGATARANQPRKLPLLPNPRLRTHTLTNTPPLSSPRTTTHAALGLVAAGYQEGDRRQVQGQARRRLGEEDEVSESRGEERERERSFFWRAHTHNQHTRQSCCISQQQQR